MFVKTKEFFVTAAPDRHSNEHRRALSGQHLVLLDIVRCLSCINCTLPVILATQCVPCWRGLSRVSLDYYQQCRQQQVSQFSILDYTKRIATQLLMYCLIVKRSFKIGKLRTNKCYKFFSGCFFWKNIAMIERKNS
jgi:hypothetical protein